MSVLLTPQQTLTLLTLVGASGQAEKKAVKPAADGAMLLAAGLIAEGWKAEDGKTVWVEVTDKGWAWAGEHLADDLPPKSQPLQIWLRRIKRHLDATGTPLAELFMPAPEPLRPEKPKPPTKPRKAAAPKPRRTVAKSDPKPRKPTIAQLRKRIVTAYAAVAGSASSARVRLSDLRDRLADVDRSTLDAALLRLHEKIDDKISLMPLEDPRQVTEAVRDAAVGFKGEALHLLWIDP